MNKIINGGFYDLKFDNIETGERTALYMVVSHNYNKVFIYDLAYNKLDELNSHSELVLQFEKIINEGLVSKLHFFDIPVEEFKRRNCGYLGKIDDKHLIGLKVKAEYACPDIWKMN